jgi:hypothetical protein
MWMPVIGALLALLVLSGFLTVAWGKSAHRKATSELVQKLERAAQNPAPATYNAEDELAGLPEPARRYFQTALQDGQKIVAKAEFSQEGDFRGDPASAWSPFVATQTVATSPPSFIWDAAVRMMPGASVFVHDAYIEGEGLLRARLLGLVTVAEARGGDEIAEAELMRYRAEAAWYPTALLPSQGVEWEPVDDTSARATLADGEVRTSLVFIFDDEGLIAEVRADKRYRGEKNGVADYAPWRGRFWNYETRGGMKVPLEGEVAWEMPNGELFTYWRGQIKEIDYSFASDDSAAALEGA